MAVAAMVAAMAAALAGVAAFLHLPAGERFLARAVGDALPEVAVDGLEVAYPFALSARSIAVADRDGIWLTIVRPHLDWHPLKLWRRLLHVDRLAAERVVVARLPEPRPEPAAAPADGFDPFAVALRLDAVAAPIVLEPAVVGEQVELDLSGRFRMLAGGGEVDMHLQARGGGIARLAGIAGRDFLDLRWYLTVPELERWQRLAGTPLAGRLVASGSIAGRLPAPALTGAVEVGPGRAAGIRWQELAAMLHTVPGESVWQGSATVAVQSPRIEGGTPLLPEARLMAVFDLAPAEGRLRIGTARLTGDGLQVAARGVIGRWGRHADLRVEAEADDLARLGGLTGMDLAGTVRAEADLAGDLLAPQVAAVARLDTRGLATGIEVLDRLLGERPRARAVVAVDRRWRPRVVSATVEGARARAILSGPAWPLALNARVSVPDLSVLAEALAGAGVAHGRVLADSTWGMAELRRLSAAGGPPADGGVGFDFRFTDLAGTVTADLRMMGRPLQARAGVAVAEEVRIDDLVVISRDSRVAGGLAVGDGGAHGRLTGDFPRLSDWREQVGVAVEGALRAEVGLNGDRATVDARVSGLAAVGTSARTARLQAVIEELGGQPRARTALTAEGVTRDGVTFDRLRAEAAGRPEDFRFAAEGAGDTRLSAAGEARLEGRRGTVALDRMELAYSGVALRLAEPTRLLWGPDRLQAERTVVTVGEGRVVASGSLAAGRIDTTIRLDGVSLALLDFVVPDLGASGVVDGSVAAGGTLQSPVARVELRGRDIGFAAATAAGIGRLSVAVDAAWAGGRVDGSASAGDGERLRLAATGSFPLAIDGDPMPAGAPVAGRVEVAGDLGRLTDALPLAGHALAGRLDGVVSVGGTVAAPRLDGHIAIDGGRYENLETGTLVTDLVATARLEGRRVTVEARGGDGRRGRLAFDGTASLAGTEPSWRGDLSLSRFRAVQRDDVDATVSADLDLEGIGGDGRLSGRAEVVGAEIDIGRLQGGGPVTLEVVEINRPGGDRRVQKDAPTRPADADRPLTVVLDVRVGIERAFVRGRGLDSEWGGRLAIGGTVAEPVLAGRLGAERGRFELLGRPFRLTPESAVVFDGDVLPRLEVAAEARAEEVVARVDVTGPADAPQLEISSQPPLPRDEVLSRVLFGTEAGKLSAFQQIQLAQMAATGLTGRGEGFDPIGGVRSALGLDVLEVGQAEEGGAAVSAGKYIGEETFLRVEQGTQGAGRVTVEQELGRGFAVTTEVGQERGGGVGVEWRKDY